MRRSNLAANPVGLLKGGDAVSIGIDVGVVRGRWCSQRFSTLKTSLVAGALLAFTASAAAAFSSAPTAPALAPAAPTATPSASAFVREVQAFLGDFKTGHYLAAIDRMDRDGHDPAFGKGADNPFFQYWQQFRPTLDERVDPASLEQGSDQPDPKDIAAFKGAKPRDAISEIVSRARHTRIVILDEAHHSPRDRAFGLQVARALRPLGYSILAVEALSNSGAGAEAETARLVSEGYPRLEDGTYIKDPAFGDFIRQSLAMGYKPVSYDLAPKVTPNESERDRIAAREQGQADNLMARIFSKDSTSKVLIYVGYDHVDEEAKKVSGSPLLLMAGRLKAATGIDPLTIDQTDVSEISTNPDERRLYDIVASRVGSKPVIFFRAGQPVKFGNIGPFTDLQVVHPRLKTVDGRPTWLLTMGRHPVKIPRDLLPKHGRRLVQAFIAGESADAVPVDQVVVEAGKPAPVLMLPFKPVRFAVQDDDSTGSERVGASARSFLHTPIWFIRGGYTEPNGVAPCPQLPPTLTAVGPPSASSHFSTPSPARAALPARPPLPG